MVKVIGYQFSVKRRSVTIFPTLEYSMGGELLSETSCY